MAIQGFASHLSRTIFHDSEEGPVPTPANIAVYSGLLIGLAYGVVGLLSGFCLLTGLRGWWAQACCSPLRTYALALGVAIVAAQLLAHDRSFWFMKSKTANSAISTTLIFD